MFAAFRFGKDLWDPSYRFETSWLMPPYVLAACRALIVSLAPIPVPSPPLLHLLPPPVASPFSVRNPDPESETNGFALSK